MSQTTDSLTFQPVSQAGDCMGMLDIHIRDDQSSNAQKLHHTFCNVLTPRGLLQAIQDWRHALQNRG